MDTNTVLAICVTGFFVFCLGLLWITLHYTAKVIK